LQAAHYWRYTIAEWENESEQNKAMAIAYMNVISMMRTYEEEKRPKSKT